MQRLERANSLMQVCSDRESAAAAAAEHVRNWTTVHGSSLSAADESDYTAHTDESNYTAHTDENNYTAHTDESNYTSHIDESDYTSHTDESDYTSHTDESDYTSHIDESNYTAHTDESDFTAHTDKSDYTAHTEVDKGLTAHDEALASKGAALQLPLQGRALQVGHYQGQNRHFGAVLGHQASGAPRACVHYDQPCLHVAHGAVHCQHQACDSASAGCLIHNLVNCQ